MLASYIVAFILTAIVVIGSIVGYDTSNITTLAGFAWGEIAVSNTFYYKKAAKENVPKIIASMDKELREQIDVNSLLNQ